MRSFAYIGALAITAVVSATPPKLPYASPEKVGLRADRLALIDHLVSEAIAQEKLPGCVVTVGRTGQIAFQKAYGNRRLLPQPQPMTVDTVFDLASLTKPVATATSMMILLERGEVRIRGNAADFLPEMANNGKEQIRVRQLLTHQSGLAPIVPVERTTANVDEGWQAIFAAELSRKPGERFVYSDTNYMLLGKIVESVSGQPLDQFTHRHLFAPLGMTETGFLPGAPLRERAAPTQQRDGAWMQGEVHDPRAHFLGGVAGHAGLFSTANDLAVYAQTMLNGGKYHNAQILQLRTVTVMTNAYDVGRGTRGLGWDKQSPYSSTRGELLSDRAFGHGGFTGTVMWIDPGLDLFVIFLSNRVHPDGNGSVNDLAGRINNVVVGAIMNTE